MHPKKRTVGVRIPDHPVVQALLEALGEPLLSSTLILPGEDEPRTDGWEIKEELDHVGRRGDRRRGRVRPEPTTVVDWSDGRARGAAGRRRGPGPLRDRARDVVRSEP